MTERHGSQVTFRTAPAVAGGPPLYAEPDPSAWREAANGKPEPLQYAYGTRSKADAARDAEIAAQVAATRAEAVRRARERLGPGPLERRGFRYWEPVEDDGGPDT